MKLKLFYRNDKRKADSGRLLGRDELSFRHLEPRIWSNWTKSVETKVSSIKSPHANAERQGPEHPEVAASRKR
jgi:hypothetical protein